MGSAMMATGARRGIASGAGTHTEALVGLLSRMSVAASCDAMLSAQERATYHDLSFLVRHDDGVVLDQPV